MSSTLVLDLAIQRELNTVRLLVQHSIPIAMVCHGGSGAMGAGIVLDNYTSVKAYVTNAKLLGSIQQNGTSI